VPQTVATWTLMETIVSIAALGGVLVLSTMVG
jgi:H+/gluconate symporter-like permease